MILTAYDTETLYTEADPALERQDCCGPEFAEALAKAVESDGGEPGELWKSIAPVSTAPAISGATIPHGGVILKTVKGMGTVYDWRDSSWTQPNGGRINPILGVQHIPVIRNVDGYGDLITLVNVLLAQGLMVQQGTDREGNVGLFVPGNLLCYQARGANQFSWGSEHMHLTIDEAWTKRQLRAAAWINQLNRKHYGTAQHRASLRAGDGIVRVTLGGQTRHRSISYYAGYNDRTDPGDGYDFEYVAHCEQFFDSHGHFEGA